MKTYYLILFYDYVKTYSNNFQNYKITPNHDCNTFNTLEKYLWYFLKPFKIWSQLRARFSQSRINLIEIAVTIYTGKVRSFESFILDFGRRKN